MEKKILCVFYQQFFFWFIKEFEATLHLVLLQIFIKLFAALHQAKQ
jgi:hypothetical protein